MTALICLLYPVIAIAGLIHVATRRHDDGIIDTPGAVRRDFLRISGIPRNS